MDLNHIELPLSVIADLYQNKLVDLTEGSTQNLAKSQPISAEPVKDKKNDKWKYLGNNRKNILIIVNDESVVHISDNELVLLTTMLSACHLSLDDVIILNRKNHPEAGYKELLAHFRSRIIFLFDIEPLELGLPVSFPHFQPQNFSGQTYLFSPSLKDLEQDKLLKSRLWLCLKRIFGI